MAGSPYVRLGGGFGGPVVGIATVALGIVCLGLYMRLIGTMVYRPTD
jgi:hypothetical protein